jgi:hypothetical protein
MPGRILKMYLLWIVRTLEFLSPAYFSTSLSKWLTNNGKNEERSILFLALYLRTAD